ncbi:DeoR/GlpR family DNA-binding transcription regulator [Rothia sp. P6271]|uniref:DeoR/GlpR family DNA-binding transcription regulator n=1 Tax=Rothia sp. P6271 TaxID=3402659 RepID=UPI003ABDFCB3
MLASERHSQILREIEARGTVLTGELVDLLNVSAMTIRRDLNELADLGLLVKVHGGATSFRASSEPTFATKMLLHEPEKQRIAQRALQYVHPGQTIGFSAGTTCTTIARNCLKVPELTVITNSLRVHDTFHQSPSDAQVLLTGGQRTPSDALVGPITDLALATLHMDVLFLGTYGADLKQGLMSPTLIESATNRALIASASQVIAVFDHSKWDIRGLSQFAPWENIDTVITGADIPHEALTILKNTVNEVVLAS